MSTSLACLALAISGCRKPEQICPQGYEVEITGNHGHELVAPKEKGKAYMLVGGSHEHRVLVREAELAQLQAGKPTTALTTSTNAHAHQLSLKCKP